ncbi:secreted protein [Melampsora americana]|nr:secreted protein [Melampsora americana]
MIFFPRNYILLAFALLTLVKLVKSKACTRGFVPNPSTGTSSCTDKDNTWAYPIEDCSYNPGHTGKKPSARSCDPPFANQALGCDLYSPLTNGAFGCSFRDSKYNAQTARCKIMDNMPSCKEGRGRFVPSNGRK